MTDEELVGIEIRPRLQEVAEALLDSCTNREIGDQLGLTERTIKAYIRQLADLFEIPGGGSTRIRLAVALSRRKEALGRGVQPIVRKTPQEAWRDAIIEARGLAQKISNILSDLEGF